VTKPPIDKFTIDLSQVGHVKAELKERMEELSGQISKVVERMKIDDNPVLIPILNMTKKRSALEKLARALNRVAPLIDEFEKLDHRLTCLQVASDEPGWLAATLGDFDFDFEGAAGWESISSNTEEEEDDLNE
jgi:hypothetical protein